MKDKINQVQRTISLLASMIDSGEKNSIQSRRDTLQALISLEEIKNGLDTKAVIEEKYGVKLEELK